MDEAPVSHIGLVPRKHPEIYSTLEVDTSALLPEVIPLSGKEVYRPAKDTEKEFYLMNVEKEALSTKEHKLEASRGFARRKSLWTSLLVLVLIGAIVGGAVGGTVGRRQRNSSLATSQISEQEPGESPGTSQAPSLNTLYPNTSLAATTLPNGDRRVYFQDVSGLIREAQYNLAAGTWDAPVTYVVADTAIKGTSIATDSARINAKINEYGGDPSTYIQIGVAYISMTGPQDEAAIAMRVRGGSFDTWDNYPGNSTTSDPYTLYCSNNTKISLKYAQDSNRILNSSQTSDTWMNVAYQPVPKDQNNTAPLLLWQSESADTVVEFDGFSYSFDVASFEPGRSFSLGLDNTPSGHPFGFVYWPDFFDKFDSDPIERGRVVAAYRGSNTDLHNNSCVDCSVGGMSKAFSPNNISLSADFAVLQAPITRHRLFALNENTGLRHFMVGSTSAFITDEDREFNEFDIRVPSGKFAVTAERYGEEDPKDIYLYTQFNGTHLAEISNRKGYWNFTQILIPIS